jgi:outer membrane beta-barrel protein
MKRPAICFCLCISIFGWVGVGHAKGGKGGKAEAAPAAAEAAAEPAPSADGTAPAEAAPAEAVPADTVTPEGDESNLGVTPEGTVDTVGKQKAAAPTTLSWQDIVVVPRKAFIKSGRLELAPFSGLSVNDNLIRHYVFGADLNFFLSDVFWIGLQGQYFVKAFTDTSENVGLQYNRIPTLNRYLYGGALNMGYVPLYGKFALFNDLIMHWEIFASGGVGITVTEIIPRNPGDSTWKNNLLTPNVAIGTRFFLFNWLTINVALRDYILPDKFESANRAEHPEWTTAQAKENGEQAWVNNLMLYAGVGIYLPTKFSYKTPR